MASNNLSDKSSPKLDFPTKKVHYQLSHSDLIDKISSLGQGEPVSSGAINILTGQFTGRSPKDRFLVLDNKTKDSVWWDGNINLPFDSEKFNLLYEKMTNYLSERDEIFVRDGYACADPRYQLNIRVYNEYAWSNLFVYNMFLRPDDSDLENFKPDWLIINAPGFEANPEIDGTRQKNFSILNFEKKIALVGGTGYTGEMKKGIFSALNLILPTENNTLSMHCSANNGKSGDTALFFGLSGTGKTTLSADANRELIGDDEHGWTPDGTIFNFEGGCYAKVIDLSRDKEPEIFGAIKHGALLENCKTKKNSDEVDFSDVSITQNTRVSYPIYHIDMIAKPSLGNKPKNIFFLTFDAFGVLPPISKLNPEQAAYHFISGYTSKVAGTEEGVTEPQTTFSACFGSPFMPLHPTYYAKMLSEKIAKNDTDVWLVNTGLNGSGKRMSIKHTRAVINAALDGSLKKQKNMTNSFFGFQVPTECNGVPSDLMLASASWECKEKFKEKAISLVNKFKENFKQFEDKASKEILYGGPII